MSAVKNCLSLTETLIEQLKNTDQSNRESVIEKTEMLLAQREELLPQIRPPFTRKDQKAGRKLVSLNKELSFLLQDLNKNVLRDLNALHLKKTSAARYNNIYSRVQNDGIFYDKKK